MCHDRHGASCYFKDKTQGIISKIYKLCYSATNKIYVRIQSIHK